MSLRQAWEDQYKADTSTALKDTNLFQLEVDALINSIKDYLGSKSKDIPIKILELGCGAGTFCSLHA